MKLFEKYSIGDLELKNRIVMSPMTRSRADSNGVASDLAQIYYSQRASAGLIISEGSQISSQGVGYTNTPGIYTKEQIDAWSKITDKVHQNDGKIFLQLWHVGRVSHSSFHNGAAPVAPSAIAVEGKTFTYEGMKDFSTPKALEIDEIKQIVKDFGIAAENAKSAGFDGVDIHGAFGYLLDQFLESGSNHRTDAYGGSIENRSRFTLEVIEEVLKVWSSNRVGIKLSPSNLFNSMFDSNPQETFSYLIEKLNDYNLGYLHLMQPQLPADKLPENYIKDVISTFRPIYKGNLIANAGYTRDKAIETLESGLADMVSFGSLFISNPDLPKRFALNADLAMPDKKTFYQGGEKGFIDYPFLND